MTPEFFRIAKRKVENRDTFTLWLAPPGARTSVPGFKPGQFNMLYAFGVGEVAISISGLSDDDQGQGYVHTIRSVGSVTGVLQRFKVGDEVGLRGPFGSSWPCDEEWMIGHDVVLVAGGIGLAPLRPVLHSLCSRRKDFGSVTLLYGARSPSDLIYKSEMSRLSKRHAIDFAVTVDQSESGWTGHVGVVPGLIKSAAMRPSQTFAMVCGPEIMMRFSIDELKRRGVPDDRIFVSLERSMKCGIGFCGHCQMMPFFMCKDGPVFRYDRVRRFFGRQEI
jgi:NAD(P)H-flavin reductase